MKLKSTLANFFARKNYWLHNISLPKAKRLRNKTYKIAENFEAHLLCINKIVLTKPTNTIKTSNSFNISVIIFNYNFSISSNSCAAFNHDIWIF